MATRKDEVVGNLSKKLLEQNEIKLNRIRGHIYEFNKKVVNIKFAGYEASNRYWFDSNINHLKEMTFFIFICKDIHNTYVIPSIFLRNELEEHGRMNNKQTSYNFHIIVQENVLFLDMEHQYPIEDYRNKFSLLK